MERYIGVDVHAASCTLAVILPVVGGFWEGLPHLLDHPLGRRVEGDVEWRTRRRP